MNQLTANNPFELDLTLVSSTNNKTYKQKIIIDCLQYKGYVNALTINNDIVEFPTEEPKKVQFFPNEVN